MELIQFLFLFTIGFSINPFFAFVFAWVLLLKNNLDEGRVTICVMVLATYWGLLAFTQKSLAAIDTDAIRYYYFGHGMIGLSVKEALESLAIEDLMNFTFTPVNAVIVALTQNVQSMSFIWVFVTYICTYYSIKRLMKHYGCYSQRNYAKVLLVVSFCFMLFVQISELLRQAPAFAVFFLGFTYYVEKGWNIKTIILIIASIGLHSSMFLFVPLLLYRYFPVKKSIYIIIALTPVLMSVNVLTAFWGLLPDGEYFSMVSEKYSNYGDGSTATPHYILIELLMLYMAIDLWRKDKDDRDINIVLLYFLISFANYGTLVAFLRFALFSHWVFAFMLVKYLTINRPVFRFSNVGKYIVIIMFFMSLRFTLSRLGMGIYPSTYMDNSIVKITTSTINDYLTVKYDK